MDVLPPFRLVLIDFEATMKMTVRQVGITVQDSADLQMDPIPR